MRNPFQLDFWSIFGPLRPLRNTAHGSKFEGFQVCKPRLKKDPKSRPGGPHFRVFSTFLFLFRPFREAKNPKLAIFAIFERVFLQQNLQCEKKRKKKRKDAQVGTMRGAGGRGGRVALACITLRVFCRRSESANRSAHRCPEGAVDFNAYGSCRPPLVIWDLRF